MGGDNSGESEDLILGDRLRQVHQQPAGTLLKPGRRVGNHNRGEGEGGGRGESEREIERDGGEGRREKRGSERAGGRGREGRREGANRHEQMSLSEGEEGK